jgi:pseudouridine-5'-phosphate glycosidase
LTIAGRLDVSADVAAALSSDAPLVALESTLISHGLPYPQNLEVARASETAVRDAGATPATIAIHDGRFRVGLDDAELEALATAPAGSVRKVARSSLAAALEARGWAATTVSATIIAAHAAGIRVFATGGIGGVHRGAIGGATPSFDISSDLEQLARTPIVVVCAGPKAILDVPATLEYLETHGVPIVTIGQSQIPGFFARASTVQSPHTVPDVGGAARLASVQLSLALAGMLVCVPVPEQVALPEGIAVQAVERASREADASGIAGPALTPWLLARIAEITDGASLRANTALIVNNARTAGEIAARLVDG